MNEQTNNKESTTMALNRNINKFGFIPNGMNKDCYQPFSYIQAMNKHKYKFVKTSKDFYLYIFCTREKIWLIHRGITFKK